MKIILSFLVSLICFSNLFAQTDSINIHDLYEFSLEDLLNVEITSVSKKAEKLTEVPVAITVVTSSDIERSGALTLKDLLNEYVPGFWAVDDDYMHSASYIRNTNSGSILYLLDGTPLNELMEYSLKHSTLDIIMSDIDRIEIIKGSGGTIYGANSATGVVSIFTKDPASAEKVHATLNVGFPSYTDASISLNKKLSDKFSVGISGKIKYFGGFEQIPSTTEETPTVPSSFTDTDTKITNRFTEDDNTFTSIAGGLRLSYKISDKLNISSKLYYNTSMQDRYHQDYSAKNTYLMPHSEKGLIPASDDTVFLTEYNQNRLTANIKLDYAFNDDHSLFAKLSTNSEHAIYAYGGGYTADNSTIDFEIQDNFTLAFNQFSIGLNYRTINYDIHSIYNERAINYVNPQNNEVLQGFFLQDKISLLENKLNFYLGVKAETFSLINDDYYLSPMAKVLVAPNDKFSVWAGLTQAYTTPGYNQTNVELSILDMNYTDYYYTAIPLMIYQGAYEQAISAGATEEQAAQQAEAYLATPEGQATVQQTIDGALAGSSEYYTLSAINGPDTKPTSVQTVEAGIRLQPSNKILIESNVYLMRITDGVISSNAEPVNIESPTRPGDSIQPYYYGNYLRQRNTGVETSIKILPSEKLMFGLSHSWFTYDTEYQENDDFDISDLEIKELDYPIIPEHNFKFLCEYKITNKTRINITGIYFSDYYNRLNRIDSYYQYDIQRFDPLFGDRRIERKFILGEVDAALKLNIRIDQSLMDEKLNIYAFGNNLLQSADVESINQFSSVYPRQVGRLVGVGVSYKL